MQFAFYYAPRSHIGQLLKLLRFAAIILSLTVLVTATASSQVFHIAAPASGDTFETKSPTTVQPPLLSPTPPVNQPVLHLINGDFCAGELLDTDQPDIVRWNPSFATQPFDFHATAVTAIYFPPSQKIPAKQSPEKSSPSNNDYSVELVGGDVLIGSLSNLTADRLVLNSPTIGLLHIDRAQVSRLEHRGDSTDIVYLGPEGVSGWQQFEMTPPPPPQPERQLRVNARAIQQQPNQNANKTASPSPLKAENLWHDEVGQLVTDHSDVAAYQQCGIPEQACVEFDVSWTNRADFALAFCLDGTPEVLQLAQDARSNAAKLIGHPFRIETWDKHLVVVRETDDNTDLADLLEINPAAGHIHLRAYIDQKLGRIIVLDEAGRQLADLKVPEHDDSGPHGGLELINRHGDVRLELLRISSWHGDTPAESSGSGTSHIRLTDGTAISGQIESFDPAKQKFSVRDGDKQTDVEVAKVSALVFNPSAAQPACTLRAVAQDGLRISGVLQSIEHGRLKLKSPAVAEQIILPLSDLKSLIYLAPQVLSSPAETCVGRLELPTARLNGWLQAADSSTPTASNASTATGASKTADSSSCLIWHPLASQTGAVLRSDISGQIIYRDTPIAPSSQTPPAAQGRVIVRGPVAVGVAGAFVQGITAVASSVAKSQSTPHTLYLRSGDIIPCQVTHIDDTGVTIKTTISDATLISHDKIKALILAQEFRAAPLDKSERQRLLTLPRMQKNSPPTQLIVSTDGDYLRGRLTGLDDKNASLEVHLETKQIPREHIARIIWFHPDELASADKNATDKPAPDKQAEDKQATDKPTADKQADKSVVEKPAPSDHPTADHDPAPKAITSPQPLLVQALRHDGVRLTFSPQQATNSTLAGISDVLGPCRVDLARVDRLLLGHAINENAARRPYNKWILTAALEPRFTQDSDSDNPADHPAGADAALVGQPAPDFTLKTLDGHPFKLSDHKGHVVVLDFFATWCGPCVAAMPQVDEAVNGFAADHVELFAVNMQEDSKTIHGLLERLNLKPNVVLDQDGAAAEKYSVTAIPQTVIIDADGKVARLFIGGGPDFGEQLHTALQEVLHPNEKTESPQPASGP